MLGPPLALGVGAIWSTGAALASAGIVMLAATLAFAAQPASRAWRPDPDAPRRRGGSLRSPAILTLALIEIATGAVFGATEVGVTAAVEGAREHGRRRAAARALGPRVTVRRHRRDAAWRQRAALGRSDPAAHRACRRPRSADVRQRQRARDRSRDPARRRDDRADRREPVRDGRPVRAGGDPHRGVLVGGDRGLDRRRARRGGRRPARAVCRPDRRLRLRRRRRRGGGADRVRSGRTGSTTPPPTWSAPRRRTRPDQPGGNATPVSRAHASSRPSWSSTRMATGAGATSRRW